MNTKTIGIILIVAGILMMVYTGFHFVTTEKVVDIGPIEINQDKNHFLQWSPIAGAVMIAVGLLLTFMKKNNS